MPSLTGILLDVSGSMKRSIGSGIDEESEDGEPWARSIFEVIDNLIKHDVATDNHVFAVGFGAEEGEKIFDILGTLQRIHLHKRAFEQNDEPVTLGHLNKIFQILENAGARNIRKWADVEVVRNVVPDYTAGLLLKKCESDQSFASKFVEECLPPACREWFPQNQLLGLMETAATSAVTTFKRATTEEVKDVIDKAAPHLMKKSVGKDSIISVHEASDILHGCFDEEELSKERSRELLRSVEPYIYGGTPLYESVERATELMRTRKFSSHEKLLFVLSDGEPGDGDINDSAKKDEAVSGLTEAAVTVVGCFVTESTTIEPKRLYSQERRDEWDLGAKFLFSLSTTLKSQLIPRTMFVKRGWSIEVTNNETRLFLQVNHPDHLREACEVARNVVCCQDALSDLLATIDLDVLINQGLDRYQAKDEQVGGTCYANASATVLHLSMKRILGREGGYPDFYKLRDECISHFGSHGANTLEVLSQMCPKYRMHCKIVDLKGAMKAVTSSRPVVATFRLTDDEWDKFQTFFREDDDEDRILTKKEIDITTRAPNTGTSGHAVVLTSFDSKSLRLLNSWGPKWAYKGFFRVQNADLLGLEFIDVYWTEDDLTLSEKAHYKTHGSAVARDLLKRLQSLQKATYKCPGCKTESPVKAFTGTLTRAKCPKCGLLFSTKDANRGNILALNIYLTSLSK